MGAVRSGDRRVSLKGLERDYRAGIGDSGNHLDPVAHVMANVDVGFHVEFGQDVEISSD
jgi:hypothetical protein